MKTQFILFLFILGLAIPLTAQKQIGNIAAAAFKHMEDKNYEAAAKNFIALISASHYSDLAKVNKKEKDTRLKALAVFHYNYATALAFTGKYEEGLAKFKEIERTTEKPEYFTFLSGIYQDRFFDNEVDYSNFEEHFKAFDDFPNIVYDVAPVLSARGLYSKALAIYTKALKKDKSPANYYHTGILNKRIGKEKEAKKLFEKGLAAFPTKQNPDNCSYQSIQILLLHELDQSDAAKKLALEILQENPNDFCAQNNFAKLKFLTKDYEQAIADYQKLVSDTPFLENGFLSIIQSYKALGQTERALTMLNDLLKVYPNYAMALAERGAILKLNGKKEQAKMDLDKAIQLMPNHSLIQQLYSDLASK